MSKPDSWVDAGAAGVKRMAEENARLRAALEKAARERHEAYFHSLLFEECDVSACKDAKAALAPKEGA